MKVLLIVLAVVASFALGYSVGDQPVSSFDLQQAVDSGAITIDN